MASTSTTFDAFLKERYVDADEIPRLVYEDRQLLSDIPKDTTGSGDYFVHPVVLGNPQGLASSLSVAQTGATAAGGQGNLKGRKWQASWGDYDGVVEIGDKVIKQSRDNAGAFLRNMSEEIDGLYSAFGDTMAYYVYADEGRALATGTISSGVVTLAAGTESDIVNIQEGMLVVASADNGTSGSHTLLGSGSIGYVIGVNHNAGTFTVSATATGSAGTPASWTGTMYFFRNGDFGGSGATRILYGLGAWIPTSDPGSTAFENIDRTYSIQKLSGVRLTNAEISGLSIEARLKKLVTKMCGRGTGPGPTDIYMNPEKWQPLADALESRGTRPLDGMTATFNFSYIELAMSGRKVKIKSDRFCPYHTAFALNMKYVKLRSMDKMPHVINGDGLEMLRKANANDYEHRIKAYPAMIVAAPGYCGRVSLL